MSSQILMIEPVSFAYNPQTAVNNVYQYQTNEDIQHKALAEFENAVAVLQQHQIAVSVIRDTPKPVTPDAVFPNNWISFHNGTICLYPMFAPNRRDERKKETIDTIVSLFKVKQIVDLTRYENKALYLEGTGSMVLDRTEKLAYACFSPRTDHEVLQAFCSRFNYTAVGFTATDNGVPVYHTNVLMCIAAQYVVICVEAIDSKDRNRVEAVIKNSGKQIVPINLQQLRHFAGNMLQVKNTKGDDLLVMSAAAYTSLRKEQIKILEKVNPIVSIPVPTIEKYGGGSIRCMMAEVV